MLPVLLLVPRLSGPPGAYSMLGYGDVVLPGLLLVRQGCAGQDAGHFIPPKSEEREKL